MGWSAGPAGFRSLKLFGNITALTWKFGEVMGVSEVNTIVLVLCSYHRAEVWRLVIHRGWN